MHHSSLSLWIQGKIRGHQVGIDETIENWLDNLQLNRPRPSKGYEARLEKYRALSQEESLVPIQLALSLGDQVAHLHLLYNRCEQTMTPEAFVKMIAEDKGLPSYAENDLLSQFKLQLEEFGQSVL